jgi:uncharacterized RDD family membrane protein YckC
VVLSTAWNILGIERTADARLIKKAYAKKLKQVRPDEKPEEFQQLHFAYKSALQEARRLAAQVKNPPHEEPPADESGIGNATENRPESTPNGKPDCAIATGIRYEYREPPVSLEFGQTAVEYTYVNQRNPIDTSDHQAELDRIMHLAETALASSTAYEVGSWQFVLESGHILEQAFFERLGLAMLRRIARYFNDEEFRQQGDFGIGLPVLHYLNSVFRWDQYEYDHSYYLQNGYGIRLFNQLEDYAGETERRRTDVASELRGAKSVKTVFKHSHAPLKYYYYGSGSKRVTALIIDLTIAGLIASLITWLLGITFEHSIEQTKHFRMLVLFMTYLIGAWLFESSGYQATPGKKALGLRVTDRDHARLGYLHGLLRIVVFAVTCLGSWITALANTLSGGNFVHDRVSRSYVIDIWRSRREQKKG